jgi:hypothetical protein
VVHLQGAAVCFGIMRLHTWLAFGELSLVSAAN